MENLNHPSPQFNDVKMARFCSFTPSSLLWRGRRLIVPFYSVQDCSVFKSSFHQMCKTSISSVQTGMCRPMVKGTKVKISFYRLKFDATFFTINLTLYTKILKTPPSFSRIVMEPSHFAPALAMKQTWHFEGLGISVTLVLRDFNR